MIFLNTCVCACKTFLSILKLILDHLENEVAFEKRETADCNNLLGTQGHH